jgi:hypothetical protein
MIGITPNLIRVVRGVAGVEKPSPIGEVFMGQQYLCDPESEALKGLLVGPT